MKRLTHPETWADNAEEIVGSSNEAMDEAWNIYLARLAEIR